MSNHFQPQGLAHWVQVLDRDRLPVLPASARRAGRLLRDPEVSLFDLGEVISSDPVMRVHVVRECNRRFGERAAGVLANPHHCAAMLGLDHLSTLLQSFKTLRGDPGEPRETLYLQAISTSLHAAEQAASWTRFRHQAGADAMFISALLYGVPQWCLWRFAQREMRAIQILQRRDRVPWREAELAVLGCTREQIAVELARRWHMPAIIVEALSSSHLPSPGFLLREARAYARDPNHTLPNRTPQGDLVNSPALAVALSNGLAQALAEDWYSPRSRRYLGLLAAYLDQPESGVEALVKSTALDTSRRWFLPGTLAPAASLIWPRQLRARRRLRPAAVPAAVARMLAPNSTPASAPAAQAHPSATPAAATPAQPPVRRQPAPIGMRSENLPPDLDRDAILSAPPPPAPATRVTAAAPRGFVSLEKKRELEQFLQRLLQHPDSFTTEYESLRGVVDSLADCTPLQRVLVATMTTDQSRLETYYSRGCDDAPGLRKCRIALQPSNLFTRLMQQPAALWVAPGRPAPRAGLVPGDFRQACQSRQFLVMSVFGPHGPFAMFYADKGVADPAGLSEVEYHIFKTSCGTCGRHLMARGGDLAQRPAT